MAQFKTAEDYKLRDSAVRSAKRLHGADWKATHEIVAVGDRFVIKAIAAEVAPVAEPVAVAEVPKAATKAPATTKAKAPVKNVTPVDMVAALNDAAEQLKSNVESVTSIAAPTKAKAPVTNVTPIKQGKGGGRPISEEQAKARVRLVKWIESQTGDFTVKQAAKALRIKRMHIGNGFRWAEAQGIIKRGAFVESKKPGRREVMYRHKDAVKAA